MADCGRMVMMLRANTNSVFKGKSEVDPDYDEYFFYNYEIETYNIWRITKEAVKVMKLLNIRGYSIKNGEKGCWSLKVPKIICKGGRGHKTVNGICQICKVKHNL